FPASTMYAERQSQWKGRRGKPRCDHCRAHNLKCDRVLPTCNHCAWAHRECKYTPLPTPAHRGIPRCDRCRFHNLKCDRSLPVCNNCQHDAEADCNYTPKKRHKVPTDHLGQPSAERPMYPPYAAPGKSASFLIEPPQPPAGSSSAPPPSQPPRPAFDPWAKSRPLPPPAHAVQPPPTPHAAPPAAAAAAPQSAPPPARSGSHSASMSGTTGKNRVYDPRHLEPWYHAHFAPLPRVILQGIRTVNPGDMPGRKEFDTALIDFVRELPADLLDVAVFPPETYSAIALALKKSELDELTKKQSGWVQYHHVRLGSRKYNHLVMPREEYYRMPPEREEALLAAYMSDVDGEPYKDAAGTSVQEGLAAFMRIPVSAQIYDILVFAHKKHPSTIGTLVEARNAGISCITWAMVEIFYRMCPRCMAKNK
ncbi:hypothetical protein K488DRAFT_18392, partial [Vararia minispora EC-137]